MNIITDIKRDREAGTPGDWGQDLEDDPDLIYGPEERRIIVARAVGGISVEEQQANARRIARVPQMEAALLAAEECERVLTAMANRVSLYSGGHDDKLVNNAEEALAAFRKALQCEED